jgi:hypothetical protein
MPGCAVTAMSEEIATLMRDRLRLQGEDLPALLARGGRQLPKPIRQEAEILVEAAALAPVPRLRSQIDLPRITLAHVRCLRHLKRIGARDRRTGYLLQVATIFAGGILTMGALLVALVAWRGLI